MKISSAMRGVVVAAAMLLPIAASTTAFAGTTTTTVERILLFEAGNLVYVYPTGGVANPPSCHGSNGNYYSFAMSRPMAKEYLALLTAALMAGKTVSFQGTGTCQDQSVSETLSYFDVLN